MSDLLDMLDGILELGGIYERYGAKGCVLFLFGIAAIIALIIWAAMWLA